VSSIKENNILFLTTEFPPQPGGIGNHALHLAKGLKNNDFNVTLICDQRSGEGKEEKIFDKQLKFQVTRIVRHQLIILSYFNRVRTAFSLARQSDIVLASGKFSLWLGGLLSLFFKRNYVAVLHGSEVQLGNPILRRFTNWSIKRFNTVIAVSHYTASLVDHLKLKNVVVIPNGFEMKLVRDCPHTPSGAPKLITVGNVTERKGQHNIINSLPTLRKRFPNLEYHVVGIPTEKEKLMKLVEHLGVAEAVVFHGKVSEERKQELLLESDVFVMLSENTASGDVEGFGIAILEGNSVGLPGIGAKGCGIEDAISDGFSGKLIGNKDHKGFVRALEEIMGDYEVYSQNAKKWAENFTWDKIIRRYIAVINNRRGAKSAKDYD